MKKKQQSKKLVKLGSTCPLIVQHEHLEFRNVKDKVDRMAMQYGKEKLRPSSAVGYENESKKGLIHKMRLDSGRQVFSVKQKLRTNKIEKAVLMIRKQEEDNFNYGGWQIGNSGNNIISKEKSEDEVINENDINMIVNANNIEHILKLNARLDDDSLSSRLLNWEKKEYQQQKLEREEKRKEIEEKRKKDSQSTKRRIQSAKPKYLQSQSYNELMEISGHSARMYSKDSSDKSLIKKRVENYFDKYHNGSQQQILVDISKQTKVIKEESSEDENKSKQGVQMSDWQLNVTGKQMPRKIIHQRPQSAVVHK